jgi:quercetin dioxygenase-like cupin family protein
MTPRKPRQPPATAARQRRHNASPHSVMSSEAARQLHDKRQSLGGTTMKSTAVSALLLSLAGSSLVAQEAAVRPLFAKDLVGGPGKELTMITVEYPPGATDPVHRHNAQALIYVLEGSIEMQVKGGAPVTLTPGQTFYEGPDDVHIVGRNASRTTPAKFVVFFVKEKGAPILTPVE